LIKEEEKTTHPINIFHNKNTQYIIIAIVIISFAIMMAGRKQFVLDPYENFIDLPQVYTSTTLNNTHGKSHPLYADGNYIPAALKVVPSPLLFSPWFHVISSIVFWILTIGGVFILIKMGGFTVYQSLAMTLFSLFAGNLITRELLDIPLLAPSPYVGYQYYSVRTPVIPLAVLGLIAIFKRHFFVGGMLIGLATFFHIKFGFRFFSLTLLSLLLWKFWGSRKGDLSLKSITGKNLISFSISWGIAFAITYLQIKTSMDFFDSLKLPQSQPLISPLAWLIKHEPDDYLVSYHFSLGRPFFGYLFMAVSTLAFCEIIIKLSKEGSWRAFAIIWQMGIIVAMACWGFGFLFEFYLINLTPISLARPMAIFRFWDLIWVVVMGFWINLFLVLTVIRQRTFNKPGKPEPIAGNLIFHFAMVLFISLNIAIFVKNKEGALIRTSDLRNGNTPVLEVMRYVQVCGDVTPEYNKFYWQAVNAIQERDEKKFHESVFRLNKIYEEFKVSFKNPSINNLDSARLNILNHFAHKRYSRGIAETVKLRNSGEKDVYWWSCQHSEPGIHHRSIRIPTKDYMGAIDWVKLNLPYDKGIIQPPYLAKFTAFSKHIGFWDRKSDQHMMYSINGYYKPGLHRIRSIAGHHTMESNPGIKSEGLGPLDRWNFMDLTKENILNIQRDYPNYHYLLTENKHLRGYPVIYANPSLTLYDISKP
jgi:hypothetical protein